tara:strand:- start:3 stop:236 length:234 start_codon:yes stop_codon:yes gene_type:complete
MEIFESKFVTVNDKILVNHPEIQYIRSSVQYQDNIYKREEQQEQGFLKPDQLTAYNIQISLTNDPFETQRLMNGMSE